MSTTFHASSLGHVVLKLRHWHIVGDPVFVEVRPLYDISLGTFSLCQIHTFSSFLNPRSGA